MIINKLAHFKWYLKSQIELIASYTNHLFPVINLNFYYFQPLNIPSDLNNKKAFIKDRKTISITNSINHEIATLINENKIQQPI